METNIIWGDKETLLTGHDDWKKGKEINSLNRIKVLMSWFPEIQNKIDSEVTNFLLSQTININNNVTQSMTDLLRYTVELHWWRNIWWISYAAKIWDKSKWWINSRDKKGTFWKLKITSKSFRTHGSDSDFAQALIPSPSSNTLGTKKPKRL